MWRRNSWNILTKMENKTIYQKLLEVQKELKPIKKDSENPFFKSMYFDINSLLAVVKPILNKNGLLLLQGLNEANGRLMLDTQIVDIESGEKVSFNTVLPEAPDAQKYGSAITYFRRYAIQSLLGLEAEDDDGEQAKTMQNYTKPMQSSAGTYQNKSPFKKASPKQVNFINKLQAERHEQPMTAEIADNLDMNQASEEINRLTAKPNTDNFDANDHVDYEEIIH